MAAIFLYNNPKWHAFYAYQRNHTAGVPWTYETKIGVIPNTTEREAGEVLCDSRLRRAHLVAEVRWRELSHICY